MKQSGLPDRVFWPVIMLAVLLLQGCAALSWSIKPAEPPADFQAAQGADETLILETEDGMQLFGQWWLPERVAPRAVILLLHGTNAHSGFYDPMADYMAGQGYAVLGVDFRGWGQSQGYARKGVVDNYDEYLLDLDVAWEAARSRYPSLPLFMQGESMGGVIALLAQVETDMIADGLVLNAPAIRPGLTWGILRVPQWLNNIGLWTLSQPGKVFPNMPAFYHGKTMERLFVGQLLTEEENQQRYLADPYANHQALPLSYFTALQEASSRVEKQLAEVTQPLMITHGTSDLLVPLKSSEFAMSVLGSDDKTLNVYEGVTHASVHDYLKEQVWADIVAWLEMQLSARAPADETPPELLASDVVPAVPASGQPANR